MTKIEKKTGQTKYWQGCGENRTGLLFIGQIFKWYVHFGNEFSSFLEKLSTYYVIHLSSLRSYPGEMKTYVPTKLPFGLLLIAQNWKQPKCHLVEVNRQTYFVYPHVLVYIHIY